jgi:hypothetical protein
VERRPGAAQDDRPGRRARHAPRAARQALNALSVCSALPAVPLLLQLQQQQGVCRRMRLSKQCGAQQPALAGSRSSLGAALLLSGVLHSCPCSVFVWVGGVRGALPTPCVPPPGVAVVTALRTGRACMFVASAVLPCQPVGKHTPRPAVLPCICTKARLQPLVCCAAWEGRRVCGVCAE